ncbi:hypothetical protein A9Q78_07360 [Methylophaga sp. 41_12_T18]|nr:hypothetical protein A9Q78_07360 [Methylophaga sp. 41_12_T18]
MSFGAHANNEAEGIEQKMPGLIEMIQQRQQHLKQALNKGGMSYRTYDDGPAKESAAADSDDESQWINTGAEAFFDGLRDPFTATVDIVNAAKRSGQSGAEEGRFFGSSSGSLEKLPKLKLRGIILAAENSSPLALLEIAGSEVHMVRVGDEISFNSSDPNQVLKVKSISRLNIVVEVGSLGDLVMVR